MVTVGPTRLRRSSILRRRVCSVPPNLPFRPSQSSRSGNATRTANLSISPATENSLRGSRSTGHRPRRCTTTLSLARRTHAPCSPATAVDDAPSRPYRGMLVPTRPRPRTRRAQCNAGLLDPCRGRAWQERTRTGHRAPAPRALAPARAACQPNPSTLPPSRPSRGTTPRHRDGPMLALSPPTPRRTPRLSPSWPPPPLSLTRLRSSHKARKQQRIPLLPSPRDAAIRVVYCYSTTSGFLKVT